MRIAFIFLVSVVSTFCSLNVPLTVKEAAGAGDVAGYPVKVGVPLPLGAYETVNSFRVTDANGATVPAQFDILARYWPRSQSIRVVLVQFMANVSNNGKSRYFLKDDGTGNASAGITFSEDMGKYAVNAGKIKFEIRKSGFNVLDRLWYDVNGNGVFEDAEELVQSGDGNGAALWDTTGLVSRDTSKGNLKFTLEEAGPLRLVLKVESPTDAVANGWGFLVRIQAYYNQPFVVLDYYLKNSVHGPVGHFLDFSKFALVNSLKNLGNATVRVSGNLTDNTGAYEGSLGTSSVTTQSTAWRAFTVNGAAKTGLAVGYADISDDQKGVMAVVRKFSEMWPAGVEVTPEKKLSVNLWPQGRYRLVDGTRRAHQVMLYFHPGNATQADLFKQAKLFQKYPVPVLQPDWYAQTHAVCEWGGVGFPSDTSWNDTLWSPATFYPPVDIKHITGWSNWGGAFVDGRDSRRDSWGVGSWVPNLETYIACGRPEYFYHADDRVRHLAEMRPLWMDGYSYPQSQNWLNASYPSSWGLRPPYYRNDTLGWSSWDLAHTWVYEVGQYYFFSGERFCADNLVMHADYLLDDWGWEQNVVRNRVAPPLRPFMGFGRQDAEPLHVIIDAYKATGERRYLDFIISFARYIVDNYSRHAYFGIFSTTGFMGALVNNSVTDIYYLLPETTPEERVLKERVLLMMKGNTDGTFYWVSNSYTTNPTAWGVDYAWRDGDTIKASAFPTPERIDGTGLCYVSYNLNQVGLMYFLMGDSCYRQIIGRTNPYLSVLNPPQHFMLQPEWDTYIPPCSYFRISTAAWYYPDQKQAAKPAAITTLKAALSKGRKVLLTWTSVGGDAYRVHWSDKPLVERSAPIAPRVTGTILWPYPDSSTSVTNLCRSMPLDAPMAPKAAGGIDSFLTSELPDSLVGRKIFFNVQAVDIVSEVDQSRGPVSNPDSIILSDTGSAGQPAPATLLSVREVYTMNSTELFVVLNERIMPQPLRIALSSTLRGTSYPILSVELDTLCQNLLRVRTAGLVSGAEYRLVLDSVAPEGGALPVRVEACFLGDFRPNVFSPRRINFGSGYHQNGYEPAHAWDGDMGFSKLWWNVPGVEDLSALNDPDSALKSSMAIGNSEGFSYGDFWFKVRVSPEIRDYRFSAFAYRNDPLRLQVEDTMVWNNGPAVDGVNRVDTLPIRIEDGMLDLVWEWLSYVHITPVLSHFRPLAFIDVVAENARTGDFRDAFLVNNPNPFNPVTKIIFYPGLLRPGEAVRLRIYNMRGQLVRDLTPLQAGAGRVCAVDWNGMDAKGRMVGGGLYLARLECGRKALCRMLVLVK